MTAAEPPGPDSSKHWYQRASSRILIVLVLAVLVVAWRAGTFDHALVNVGLNAKPCARNGFGATFCGQELAEAQERQAQSAKESEASVVKGEEEGARIKREGEETDAKLQRESEEAQRQIGEPETPAEVSG